MILKTDDDAMIFDSDPLNLKDDYSKEKHCEFNN
jgi:hypothetical protein